MAKFTVEKNYNFPPSAIACQRGSHMTRTITFDAELSFDGKHYVVGEGFKTREEAINAAQVHVEALVILLRTHAASYLKPFKQAKE